MFGTTHDDSLKRAISREIEREAKEVGGEEVLANFNKFISEYNWVLEVDGGPYIVKLRKECDDGVVNLTCDLRSLYREDSISAVPVTISVTRAGRTLSLGCSIEEDFIEVSSASLNDVSNELEGRSYELSDTLKESFATYLGTFGITSGDVAGAIEAFMRCKGKKEYVRWLKEMEGF